MKSQKISILGSTGSIGRNTLKVLDHLDGFSVAALAAGRNMELLAGQVARYKPEIVACQDDKCAEQLEELLDEKGTNSVRIEVGEAGLIAVATAESADTVVSATVGAVGLVPTLRALEAGKMVALANKESLVIAGELMTRTARENNAEILPVDSEHNAIHQCLRGEDLSEVRRLILTASGGPFRTNLKAEIENATLAEALNHPTWKMGDKITIDSATLMNKGLEVIEAHWLFGLPADRIDVIVHPQSVVHSIVEFVDGSNIAQMGVTDMRHAIQYALTYPNRIVGDGTSLNFGELADLSFENPDFERFPNLALAYSALKKGGTAPATLNASNEIAVQAFLDKRIGLSEIAAINGAVLSDHIAQPADSLERILAADNDARKKSHELVEQRSIAQSVGI